MNFQILIHEIEVRIDKLEKEAEYLKKENEALKKRVYELEYKDKKSRKIKDAKDYEMLTVGKIKKDWQSKRLRKESC